VSSIIRITLIFVTCILNTACDKKASIEITNEQAVYETLLLKRIGNTYTKYYLAKATENQWFVNNPIEQYPWNESLKPLGNISIELVKKLYEVNKNSQSLNWNPLITNSEFLSTNYVYNPKNTDPRKHCFDEDNNYRSYYTLSKVAFSKNNKIALIKFSYLCATLGGAGEFFVTFEFKNSRWQTLGVELLWIS